MLDPDTGEIPEAAMVYDAMTAPRKACRCYGNCNCDTFRPGDPEPTPPGGRDATPAELAAWDGSYPPPWVETKWAGRLLRRGGDIYLDYAGRPYEQYAARLDAVAADAAKALAPAPDHALLLAAVCSGRARVLCLGDGNEGTVLVHRDKSTHPVALDAAGCPVLTPELRVALEKST